MTASCPGRSGPRVPTSVLFSVFFALTALTGGSVRSDAPLAVFGYIASVGLLAWLIVTTPVANLREARWAMVLPLLLALLMGMQLLPLPPGWWAEMPGHDVFSAVADPVVGPRWRPWSVTPELTVESLVGTFPILTAALAAALMTKSNQLRILPFILFVATVSAVLGLVQLAGGPTSPFRWYRITNDTAAVGLFANRNHNGLLLVTAIPLCIAWARARCDRLRRGQAAEPIVLATILFCLAMATMAIITGSRFASGAALIALVLAVPQFLNRPAQPLAWRVPRKRLLAIVAGGLLISILLGALILLSNSSGLDRALREGLGDDVRTSVLPGLFKIVAAFWPFGSGFGSFASVYRSFEPFDLLRNTYLNAAHNDLIQLVIEGGAPAMLLLAVYLWFAVRATRNAWRPSAPGDHGICRAAATVVWLILLSELVDYALRTPLMGVLWTMASVWLIFPPRRDLALPGEVHNLGEAPRPARRGWPER